MSTTWSELSKDSKNILEWTEDMYSGKRHTLTIEKGKIFRNPVKYIGAAPLEIMVSDSIFEEIKTYLHAFPSGHYEFTIKSDILTVKLV
jgi:hypothetical protein